MHTIRLATVVAFGLGAAFAFLIFVGGFAVGESISTRRLESPTPARFPTLTSVPSATFTSTPTPAETPTATPSDSPTASATPTLTSTDTVTPSSTPTSTSTPTDTEVPTSTPTASPSPTAMPSIVCSPDQSFYSDLTPLGRTSRTVSMAEGTVLSFELEVSGYDRSIEITIADAKGTTVLYQRFIGHGEVQYTASSSGTFQVYISNPSYLGGKSIGVKAWHACA